MKLSEAIMLGASTVKMVSGDWNICALGAAGNAVGIRKGEDENGNDRAMWIENKWPWLTKRTQVPYREAYPLSDSPDRLLDMTFTSAVYCKFDNLVCNGKMTLEQLVDYVKTIEPECGECNAFECQCAKPTQQCDSGSESVCDRSAQIAEAQIHG